MHICHPSLKCAICTVCRSRRNRSKPAKHPCRSRSVGRESHRLGGTGNHQHCHCRRCSARANRRSYDGRSQSCPESADCFRRKNEGIMGEMGLSGPGKSCIISLLYDQTTASSGGFALLLACGVWFLAGAETSFKRLGIRHCDHSKGTSVAGSTPLADQHLIRSANRLRGMSAFASCRRSCRQACTN